MLMAVGYGEKIIILKVKELPLDLAYLCISYKYSRELAQTRMMPLNHRMIKRKICEAVKITRTILHRHKHGIYTEDYDEQESVHSHVLDELLDEFEVSSASEFPGSSYDFVTFCLHGRS
jgi:hypothetical protein